MKRSAALSAGLLSILFCLAASAFAGTPITIGVGLIPNFVAVNQTTNFIYVSNSAGSSVSVIDGATNTVVATIPVGDAPESIDVNPVTNTVYVANSDEFLGGGSVSVIDGSTNTVVATITGLSEPYGLAVNSVTNEIFVSNHNSSNVSVIDGATNAIIATITVGSLPQGVALNSARNLIYVANPESGTISAINGATDTVTNTFTLPQGAGPGNLALDPITNRLFATDDGNGIDGNGVVYVLNASSGTLLGSITGGGLPFRPGTVAMLQPGKSVLISDYSFNTGVLDVNELTYDTSGILEDGSDPIGIAVNRKTGKIYVTESGNNTVNVYTE
jgi:YVTN family beta-propeller protein